MDYLFTYIRSKMATFKGTFTVAVQKHAPTCEMKKYAPFKIPMMDPWYSI